MIRISDSRKLRLFPVGLLLFMLCACGEQASDNSCRALGDNLLQDTLFTTLKVPRAQRRWQSSEHSGGSSFSYSAEDGVLTIEQKGLEPWMIITQSPEAGKLAGDVVEFSADIKLDLTPPERVHDFKQGGGLMLQARQSGQVVLNSLLDHQPHMGTHDWQTVRIVLALPSRVDYLRAGFIHQASGVLQVRGPSLRQVAQTCPLTPVVN